MKRLFLLCTLVLFTSVSAFAQEQFSLFLGGTGYSIQEPPSGHYLLTLEPVKGENQIGQGVTASAFYQKDVLWSYGKLSYSSVYEESNFFESKNYRYTHLTAGIGARTKYFGVGVGLSYLLDLDRRKSAQGINVTLLGSYPIADKFRLTIMPDMTFTAFARQVVTVSLGVEYKLSR